VGLRSILIGGILAVIGGGAAAAGDREDILAVETRWNAAIVEKDAAALGEILGDDFVIITANGYTGGKAELIQAVTTWKGRVEPFVTRDVAIRVYGDTAVATGWFEQTTVEGDKRTDYRQRYTDVYVKRGGRWTAVSAQATNMPAGRP
jgi:uncharacterized protein (TIGR02246 family)